MILASCVLISPKLLRGLLFRAPIAGIVLKKNRRQPISNWRSNELSTRHVAGGLLILDRERALLGRVIRISNDSALAVRQEGTGRFRDLPGALNVGLVCKATRHARDGLSCSLPLDRVILDE